MLRSDKIQEKKNNSNFSVGGYETTYRGTQPGSKDW